MPFNTLKLEIDTRIATLTFNCAEKRDAISPEMITELLHALDEIQNNASPVLILTDGGRAFCADMDLQELRDFRSQLETAIRANAWQIVRLSRQLYAFPKPTAAAVNGGAIATGCGLAVLCDFTLAVPEAKFRYTELRVGFIPAIVSQIRKRKWRGE